MFAVRLFFGAFFIYAEFTDISFEVETVLCFDFYAIGDVFRRNGIVQQDRHCQQPFWAGENYSEELKHPPPFVPTVKMVNEAWKGFASCTGGALHGTPCRFIILCAWHDQGVQDTKCFIGTPFQMKQLHFAMKHCSVTLHNMKHKRQQPLPSD